VAVSDLTGALLEPQAGVLRAATAVRALVTRAVRHGAKLTLAPAEPVDGGVRIGDKVHEADVVIWACGPWLPRLFPDLVRAEVTKQDVLFFGAGPEWASPGVPGWVDFDGAMYGCGDLDGLGFKAASDLNGDRFDPDHGERTPTPRAVTRAESYLAHRFPALAGAPIVFSRTCQYTSTPDGRWIIAPHPEHPRVWLVGGGSGHGFKHGPALAEYVGRLIDGSAGPDPRFGLGPRSAGVSLRTHPGS
jgi:glycine/D-amino acid oxidase-like deaminating enzyme